MASLRVASLLTLSTMCLSASDSVAADVSGAVLLTPLEPSAISLRSGPESPLYAAIRSQAEWSERWRALAAHGGGADSVPPAAPPDIDFQTQTLLIAGWGAKPSGGYTVAIASATRLPDRIAVGVIRISPGENCIVIAAFTYPVAFALIPATALPVEFNFKDQVENCAPMEWPSDKSLERGHDQ